jgi:UDP-N-acetylmuramate dehydrogenase
MNAGCYGAYVADALVEIRAVLRSGEIVTVPAADLALGYRRSALPEGAVITRATFAPPPGEPEALAARMADQIARRDASQPWRERTAGSTFRNPAGFSSTGREGDAHDLKAWSLIDRAGLRGARRGGAQMSVKHPNFLVNLGGASAADLEGLGEEVRMRVSAATGHDLEWEVIRVGLPS